MLSSDTRCSQKCEYSIVFPICQAYHLHSFSSSFWPVAKFIVSHWDDKVNSGIGWSYRPAMIGWQAGMTTLYAGDNYILQSGTKNLTVCKRGCRWVDGGTKGGGWRKTMGGGGLGRGGGPGA
jgi:hypothetical protein